VTTGNQDEQEHTCADSRHGEIMSVTSRDRATKIADFVPHDVSGTHFEVVTQSSPTFQEDSAPEKVNKYQGKLHIKQEAHEPQTTVSTYVLPPENNVFTASRATPTASAHRGCLQIVLPDGTHSLDVTTSGSSGDDISETTKRLSDGSSSACKRWEQGTSLTNAINMVGVDKPGPEEMIDSLPVPLKTTPWHGLFQGLLRDITKIAAEPITVKVNTAKRPLEELPVDNQNPGAVQRHNPAQGKYSLFHGK
jgi:hypothetical protein